MTILIPDTSLVLGEGGGNGGGGGSGLYTLRETVVLSDVAEVVVRDLTRSDYLIKFMNFFLDPSVNEAALRMECSNDNGLSFIIANYQYVAFGFGMDGTTTTSDSSTSEFIGITSDMKRIGGAGPTAFEYGTSGEIRLSNTSNATQPMYVSVEGQYQDKDRKGFTVEAAGMTTDKNQTVASFNIDAVRLFFANSVANIDSGTIEVWEGTVV